MKKALFVFALLTLTAVSACKKTTTNLTPQYQWTYLGTTIQADSFGAYIPNGIVSYSEIDAYRGTTLHPTDGFDMHISSLATGTYSSSAYNTMTSWASGDYVNPFTVTITSNTGTSISGTFSGTYMSNSLTGSFTNIPIH